MSPGSRDRWRKESVAHARSWLRARRARPSIGYGKRPLVFPDDADDDPLHDDIALIQAQRLHRVVRRLQPDPPAGFAIETFHRGALSMDQRDHGLAGVGLVPFLNDDV